MSNSPKKTMINSILHVKINRWHSNPSKRDRFTYFYLSKKLLDGIG